MRRRVWATGKVVAVRTFSVLVPRISGRGSQVTLTRLAENGVAVKKADNLAEFDRTAELDKARETKGKYEDLVHQVEERKALNRASAAKRMAELGQAEADLAKALLQLRKGPILGEIERLKSEIMARDARMRVASLKKSHGFHEKAEAAGVRVLELQRDRKKVEWERAENNAEKLLVDSPLDGMVALERVWRAGSFGHPQVGDQLWTGQRLLNVFDPSEMKVQVFVDEPDGAILVPGCRARVRLDAYPELEFSARFEVASPVASGALATPLKSFAALFRFEKSDRHLLPDLSAAVIIEAPEQPDANLLAERKATP